MEFNQYYKSLKKSERERLAERCSVSIGYLKLLCSGHRRASADLAIVIERESGGLVRCETLRPDVDWAYIRGTAKVEAA